LNGLNRIADYAPLGVWIPGLHASRLRRLKCIRE
jgi:hypothetical protein